MNLSIADQVRTAFRKVNRTAALFGAAFGAFVPLATFTLAHRDFERDTLQGRFLALLVLAGLVYSATTVAQWARVAFGQWPKAIGFVVLLEGTMVAARTLALSIVGLAILVVINALATACNIAVHQRETRKASKVPHSPPRDTLFAGGFTPPTRPARPTPALFRETTKTKTIKTRPVAAKRKAARR